MMLMYGCFKLIGFHQKAVVAVQTPDHLHRPGPGGLCGNPVLLLQGEQAVAVDPNHRKWLFDLREGLGRSAAPPAEIKQVHGTRQGNVGVGIESSR